MKKIMNCKVVGYTRNSAIVDLENGARCYLPSNVISDVNMSVNEKVFVGQTLIVTVEETLSGLLLGHKELMPRKEQYISEHLGESVKGRVVFTTNHGCMLELNGNTYCHVSGMCNLVPGTIVWASISMKGWVNIDSVLYDEDKCYYPTYEYSFDNLNSFLKSDVAYEYNIAA